MEIKILLYSHLKETKKDARASYNPRSCALYCSLGFLEIMRIKTMMKRLMTPIFLRDEETI
ncbi:hypothetical protein KAI60_02095 [Candidatus Bathyarchaeota archaeon]|nr:hypothetical protein [Candidatus Bathyarchaeota archaeon]